MDTIEQRSMSLAAEQRGSSLAPVVSSSLGPLTKIKSVGGAISTRPTVWSPVSAVKDISTHGAMPLHLQQLLGTGTYQVSWFICRRA